MLYLARNTKKGQCGTMSYKIEIPKYVNFVLENLNTNGFEAYIVGGCVRDSIMGKPPYDWDVCTSASPDEVISVFDDILPVIPTGIKHGTVTILSENKPIEVTTFRREAEYFDNRHPESVDFVTSLEVDLSRRDFTSNALAYNSAVGIVDLFGGIKDIENKILKTVGTPTDRFNEDSLRILRAIRFSAVCGFEIESDTKRAIHELAHLLKNISAERILSELTKILLSPAPSNILIEFWDVFKVFLNFDIDKDFIKAVDNLPQSLALRLALVLDSCDDESYTDTVYALKLNKKTRQSIFAIRKHSKITPPESKAELKHMLSELGVKSLGNILLFCKQKSKDRAFASSLIMLSEIIENNECFSLNSLNINGSDITSLGINDGNLIGSTLNKLLYEVIEEKIENKKNVLLKRAKEMVCKG